MQYIYDQLRDAGIVVPFISNDASAKGNNAPGKPAPVDIYGHDGYPLVCILWLKDVYKTYTNTTSGLRLREPKHLARR
jgi:hypothetical protein